jgi:hypothetical protein
MSPWIMSPELFPVDSVKRIQSPYEETSSTTSAVEWPTPQEAMNIRRTSIDPTKNERLNLWDDVTDWTM